MGLREIAFCAPDRSKLKRTVTRLARTYKPIIASYASKRAPNKRCRGIAKNLLRPGPRSGASPSTTACSPQTITPRALRGAVVYRKLSLGTQSNGGERRIERLLSAHTTCRLQHRSLFAYLNELLTAHTRGDPAPQLA